MGERAAALAVAQLLRQIRLFRGEEPDRAMILVSIELCCHRLGMAVLDAVQAQHQGHVRAERFPEFWR